MYSVCPSTSLIKKGGGVPQDWAGTEMGDAVCWSGDSAMRMGHLPTDYCNILKSNLACSYQNAAAKGVLDLRVRYICMYFNAKVSHGLFFCLGSDSPFNL